MNFIVSQILGIIALILMCIGYFVKNKSQFLIIQIIANVFYATSYLFLGVFSAGIITLISIIRCVLIYFNDKKDLKIDKFIIPFFIVAYIVVGVIFWKSPFDIIPIITASLFTISFCIKNLKVMRYILLFPNCILVVFGICTMAYSVALLDFVETIVLVVAIIKFHYQKEETKEGKSILRN